MLNFGHCFKKPNALIKFLAIFLLVILVIRLINRMLFAPYVYTQPGPQKEPKPKHKEGTVILEKNGKSDKRISKDDGEFVDYEEVK